MSGELIRVGCRRNPHSLQILIRDTINGESHCYVISIPEERTGVQSVVK